LELPPENERKLGLKLLGKLSPPKNSERGVGFLFPQGKVGGWKVATALNLNKPNWGEKEKIIPRKGGVV